MLVLSIGLIAFSFTRSIPVYDEDAPEDEFAFFQDVPEITLSRDGTFAGCTRSPLTGRLITTYDRDQPPGRVACPT